MANLSGKHRVSIVVPVYNVEKYIVECLDSLLRQTYENIEIIAVNDGSTDDSGDVVDSYVKKDARVKVVHKKNGGLSDARNAGVSVATGEYIMLVDSDDYVDSRFVEAALQSIEKNDADIACFRFTYVSDDGSFLKQSSVNTKQDYKEYSNIDSIKDIFSLGGTLKVNAWNKIYKRRLFTDNNIAYPVGRLYEDNLTTYKLMFFAKRIIYFNESLLFYRQRPGSIMKNRLTMQGIKNRVGMVNETLRWLDGKINAGDMRKIQKIYTKTLSRVLAHEAIVKKQPLVLLFVAIELFKSKPRAEMNKGES